MVDKKLLNKATRKYKTSNEDIPTDGSFDELIVKYYLKYEPSKRGKALETYFINLFKGLVDKTPEKWDSGDFHINCDYMLENNVLKKIHNFLQSDKLKQRVKDKKLVKKVQKEFYDNLNKYCSTFFEFKTSYLNDRGYYRIGNIRTYQNYDYLMLLLIDCENSFKYSLYLIPMSEIHTFNLCHMHGTSDSNKETQNPHLSFSMAKGSELERKIVKWKIPYGITYLLSTFETDFKKKRYDLKFIDESLFDKIINDEMKKNLKLIGGSRYLNNKEIKVVSYINEKFGNFRKEVIYHNKTNIFGHPQLLSPEYFWYDDNNNLVMNSRYSNVDIKYSICLDIIKNFKLSNNQLFDYICNYFHKHKEFIFINSVHTFEND